jgi:AcrR family transcriptional regulator
MDAAASTRPRIEGEREREIYDATLQLVVESGYDKLTLDAVAGRAKASKATLYRRWSSKIDLVLDAISCMEIKKPATPDTGTLRGDLLAMAASKGLLEPERADVLCGLATAMYRDPELRSRLVQRFGDPRHDHLRNLLVRARDRGEIRADADLDLLSKVIPALVLFQLHFATPGEVPPGFVVDVIDEVLLPALQAVPGH